MGFEVRGSGGGSEWVLWAGRTHGGKSSASPGPRSRCTIPTINQPTPGCRSELTCWSSHASTGVPRALQAARCTGISPWAFLLCPVWALGCVDDGGGRGGVEGVVDQLVWGMATGASPVTHAAVGAYRWLMSVPSSRTRRTTSSSLPCMHGEHRPGVSKWASSMTGLADR